jgi:hypothetical protein
MTVADLIQQLSLVEDKSRVVFSLCDNDETPGYTPVVIEDYREGRIYIIGSEPVTEPESPSRLRERIAGWAAHRRALR